ncbi:MAG: RnfABCDGE type electron transport complex subunit D [Kiritimatiellia bacterium]
MGPGNDSLLTVSSSPHVHSGASVRRIMMDVIIALLPVLAVSIYFFGRNALRLVTTCVLVSVAAEFLCRKAMRRDPGIGDLSAVVTGLLLAFNLPPALPTWLAAVGAVFAIVVAKQLFGGLGYNPFNPALAGRVALLISVPGFMTVWSKWHIPGTDAVTAATPLGMAKEALQSGKPVPFDFTSGMAFNFLVGDMNGCIGEVSAAAVILGGLYLLFRRCISWHIPVFYVGTVALFSWILYALDPAANMPPGFHVLAGGLMLGAVFMATDMVTSPVTGKGKIVFGVGCGVITMVIRRWGGYPEGVSFAILLMNSVVPLINRAARPRVFGKKK